jgi:ABC-type polysaccharide/polyol phosphate transport system ATPase subunit
MPLFNMMEGMMPDATEREFVRIRGILLGLESSQTDAVTEEGIGAQSDVARWLGARPTRI